MLTCQQVTDAASDWLDPQTPWQRRVRCWIHIATCRHCRHHVKQLKITARTLQLIPKDTSGEDIRAALIDQFRDQAINSPRPIQPQHHLLGMLAKIERYTAAYGALWLIGLSLLGLLGTMWVHGFRGGGVLGGNLKCFAMPLLAGYLPLFITIKLARGWQVHISAGTLAVVALLGALPMALGTHLACDLSHSAPHALAFHVGGMLAAIASGSSLSRWTFAR